jgi:hypothetical protein
MKHMSIFKAAAHVAVAATTLLASCASTTQIRSIPSGAAVYVDQQPMGRTPYSHSDTKIVGMGTSITLKLEGYHDFNTTIVRSERPDIGAIVGGVFFIVPFLWTMGYNPVHQYELEPVGPLLPSQGASAIDPGQGLAAELVKLKGLLDAKAVTEDEFTTFKVAILQGNYDLAHSPADQLVALRKLQDQGLLTASEYEGQKAKLIGGK